MELGLQKLHHLVTVARHANLSRAASELHISQPALSRSIASLEARYGIRIFDRGKSGMSLTPVGQMVALQAEKILRDARDLEKHMRLYGTGDGGRFNLGITPAISSILLPYIGVNLVRDRPFAELITSIRPADVLIKDLFDDKIEIMLCPSQMSIPTLDLSIRIVGRFHNILVARAGHPLCRKKDISEEDLVMYPLAAVATHAVQAVIRTTGSFICENDYIVREIVLNSDAIWIASSETVRNDLDSGLLVNIESEAFSEQRVDVALIHLKRRHLSKLSNKVIDLVDEFFGNAALA